MLRSCRPRAQPPIRPQAVARRSTRVSPRDAAAVGRSRRLAQPAAGVPAPSATAVRRSGLRAPADGGRASSGPQPGAGPQYGPAPQLRPPPAAQSAEARAARPDRPLRARDRRAGPRQRRHRQRQVAYQNDDFQVPPPDTSPPPIPLPQTYSEAEDLADPQPVLRPDRARSRSAATTSRSTWRRPATPQLETHFNGLMECLVRVWQPPVTRAGFLIVRPTRHHLRREDHHQVR